MLLLCGRPLYVYTVLSVLGTSCASISRSSFLTLFFSQWHHKNKESLFLFLELLALTRPQAHSCFDSTTMAWGNQPNFSVLFLKLKCYWYYLHSYYKWHEKFSISSKEKFILLITWLLIGEKKLIYQVSFCMKTSYLHT